MQNCMATEMAYVLKPNFGFESRKAAVLRCSNTLINYEDWWTIEQKLFNFVYASFKYNDAR